MSNSVTTAIRESVLGMSIGKTKTTEKTDRATVEQPLDRLLGAEVPTPVGPQAPVKQDAKEEEITDEEFQDDFYVEQILIEKVELRLAGTKTKKERGINVKHLKQIPMADMEIVLSRRGIFSYNIFKIWKRSVMIVREHRLTILRVVSEAVDDTTGAAQVADHLKPC
ncbi:hypothetical protein L1987_29959 [Smallanthus sonchifolius]|uniref:Uncharacterized protein n=1 Tax=Smallanthus sonchifolius TaxID=185202 RepID=A0ACB9I240_9ASTR|nr:hypothetical protein L1987_29959 [Smallanthus sonchifolius]